MKPTLRMMGGARLFCISTDRFKSEYFSLRCTVPLSAQTAQQNALLMAVLGRGTEQYPTKLSINRRLDELYSTAISTRNQRVGDMQCIGFSADFLGARYVGGKAGILPDVIDVMDQLWLHPVQESGLLRQELVESEKNNLRDVIRAAINNPRGYALSQCRKLLCEGEPFGLSLIGEEESVSGITAEALSTRHKALCREVAPTFFYVGSLPPDAVAELIRDRFGLGGETIPYSTVVKKGEGDAVWAEEEMPLCQGKLAIGFRTDISLGHPLAPALLVLNEIYGGSPASKLFLNVRERRSLCYHCSSSLDLYKGVMMASAGMKPQNRGITEEAMLQELASLAAGNISNTEFEAARRSLDHSYRQAFDNPAALSDFYAGRDLIRNTDTVDDFRLAVARVTREDVIEAAAHIRKGATFFLKGTLEGEEEEE